jgi:hypothetical protein
VALVGKWHEAANRLVDFLAHAIRRVQTAGGDEIPNVV